MNRLTLCMIVKNEEAMLGDCLRSIDNIADQIVIVDTGSSDKTLEIAAKYDSEIFHFPWTGNFAEARNESIKYATSNWILWLDADERLNPTSIKELQKIIDKKPNQPEIYKINIRNYQKGDYHYISDAHRLFSNNFGIEFSGRIHEQISPSCNNNGGKEFATNIEILHYGYNLDEEGQRKKNARNRKLLEKMVAEQPDYAYGFYTLAQNYAMDKLHEKAVENFQKALQLNQLNKYLNSSLLATYAESLIALEQFDKARELISQSLEIEDEQTAGYYLLYKIAEKSGNFEDIEKTILKLREVNNKVKQSGKKNSTDVIIDDEKILQTLAMHYANNGYPEKFATTCQIITDINGNNGYANRSLLNYYADNKNFESAFHHLTKIADTFTIKDEKYLDLVALLFLKNEKYEMSIYTYNLLLNMNINNQNALKKIVGLLAKTGRRQEAEDFLAYYQQRLRQS